MALSGNPRVVVFVDGFNLYHFIHNHKRYRRYKWLDLNSLSGKFLPPSAAIQKIVYFSAYPFWNPSKVKRHQLYVKILESNNIVVNLGYFKKVKRRVNLLNRCSIEILTHEEKETDVSIGIEMILAAHRNEFDIALLISGDTDFRPAIKAIKDNFPEKKVWIVVPDKKLAASLDQLADRCSVIKERHLSGSQYPERIRLRSGQEVTRPKKWRQPN